LAGSPGGVQSNQVVKDSFTAESVPVIPSQGHPVGLFLKIQKKAALRLRCCELKNVFDRKKRCFARTRKRAKVNLLELAIKIGVIHKK